MRYLLWILFLSWTGGIFWGYYTRSQDYALGEKIIGFSVLGGVICYLPLFLYHRWKGKSLKDYTLTQENLERMQQKKTVSGSKSKTLSDQ